MNKPVSQKQFIDHCMENAKTSEKLYETSEKLDRLMPLADLVPVLKQIVSDRQMNNRIGKLLLKVIGVIGAIIGIIYGVLTSIKYTGDIWHK